MPRFVNGGPERAGLCRRVPEVRRAEGPFSTRIPQASRWDTGTLNPKSSFLLASFFCWE